MNEWFYVRVELSAGHWVVDRFASKADCEDFFAQYPEGLEGFKYRWEEISEDEYNKEKSKGLI